MALLHENPGALAHFVELTVRSRWLAEELAQHPAFLDALLDQRHLAALPDRESLAGELHESICSAEPEGQERVLDTLREFKEHHVFNVSLAEVTLCPLCGGQLRVIGDITDPDLIRKILDHANSRAPPRRANSHQTCSPNAEKHPATGPPARPKLQLPETRYPASGNDLGVREPCARLFRELREQASRSRGTSSTPTRQGRGKGPLNYLSSIACLFLP